METIDINLLPGRKRKRRLSKEEKQIIFVGVSVFFLLFAMYGGVWFIKNEKMQKLNDLNNQIGALVSVQKVLDERNALGAKVFYYESTIKKYTLKQNDWNMLIKEIASSLPKETTIKQITADRGSQSVTITGSTKNLQTLAWTMYGLKNNKNFSNVTLKNYIVPYGGKVNTQKGPALTSFTITFKWKGMRR